MYLAIVIPSDKQNFWWLVNGWFLRHSLSIKLIYLLKWTNKGVSTPCFYICNFNLYSIIIGYTRLIIFLETTYQPFTYTVAIVFNWFHYFPTFYFAFRTFETRWIINTLILFVTHTISVDLFPASVILYFVKVSEGGINTSLVYTWAHRVSYKCSTYFFYQISFVLGDFFWFKCWLR